MHGYKWPINCTRTRTTALDGGDFVALPRPAVQRLGYLKSELAALLSPLLDSTVEDTVRLCILRIARV